MSVAREVHSRYTGAIFPMVPMREPSKSLPHGHHAILAHSSPAVIHHHAPTIRRQGSRARARPSQAEPPLPRATLGVIVHPPEVPAACVSPHDTLTCNSLYNWFSHRHQPPPQPHRYHPGAPAFLPSAYQLPTSGAPSTRHLHARLCARRRPSAYLSRCDFAQLVRVAAAAARHSCTVTG